MEIAKERNSNFELVDEKMAIIVGQLIKADLAEEVKKRGGPDDQSVMDLLEEISLPMSPIPGHIPTSNLDESRGIEDNKMIKALRDIQHRLKRIEDKIDNLDGLEIKDGDKLVFKEENGKIVVKKG